MRKKREKLIVVFPSGKESEIGFLSPCKDGFVLGASQIKGTDTSHLTVLSKKGAISAHITPQYQSDREYFSSINKKEIVRRYKSFLMNQMLSPLAEDQLSQNIIYVTDELFSLLNSLKRAIYQKRTTKKEKIHVLNFKRAVEKAPELFKKMMDAPQSFFGECKAEDLLKDKEKILGITPSKIIVFRYRRKLYGVDFSTLMAFDFLPTKNHPETSNPLKEIFESFGIYQYIQRLQDKNIIERLFKE